MIRASLLAFVLGVMSAAACALLWPSEFLSQTPQSPREADNLPTIQLRR